MAKIVSSIRIFLAKYSTLTHFLLWLWNAFLVSWATGAKATISGIDVDARLWVSVAQAHLHLPTWCLTVVTLGLNALVFYNNWKNQFGKVTEAKKVCLALKVKDNRCIGCGKFTSKKDIVDDAHSSKSEDGVPVRNSDAIVGSQDT